MCTENHVAQQALQNNHCSTSGRPEFGRSSGQIPSNLAVFGPILVEIGQCLAQFGQFLGKFGRGRAGLGRFQTNGPNLVEVDRINFGGVWSNYDYSLFITTPH